MTGDRGREGGVGFGLVWWAGGGAPPGERVLSYLVTYVYGAAYFACQWNLEV